MIIAPRDTSGVRACDRAGFAGDHLRKPLAGIAMQMPHEEMCEEMRSPVRQRCASTSKGARTCQRIAQRE